MENSLVTIIVPVYNAERFLDKCIQSIQNQTYQDIEIILVNDGSTDDSLTVCETYSTHDSRIVVLNKVNEGVSSARNHGIEAAKGEFCCFVDADDWIEKTHIKNMVDEISDVDCLIQGYVRDTNDNKINCQLVPYEYYMNDLNTNIIEPLFEDGFIHPCWNKLFKTHILNKFDIRFDEKIHISEDSLFCLNYLQHCNKLRISASVTYHYCVESTNTSLSKKVYDDIFSIYGEVYWCLEKLLLRGECNKKLRQKILVKTLYPQIYSSVIKVLRDTNKAKMQKKQLLDKMNTTTYCQNVLAGALEVSDNKIERTILKLIINRRYRLLEAIWKWVIK